MAKENRYLRRLIPYPAALANAASVFLGPPGFIPVHANRQSLDCLPAGIQNQIAPQAMVISPTVGALKRGYNAIAPRRSVGEWRRADIRAGNVNSYELGSRANGSTTIALNFDVFREDYTGRANQRSYGSDLDTYDIAVRNAANSVSQGRSSETQWRGQRQCPAVCRYHLPRCHYKNFAQRSAHCSANTGWA